MGYVTNWKGVGDDDPLNTPISVDPTDSETTVSNDAGQTSSIPSSSAGGGVGGSTATYVSVNGICTPTNSDSLAQFKELQRQCNRIADNVGWTKIQIDGSIGPATMTIVGQVKTLAAASASTDTSGAASFLAAQVTSSCTAVADQASSLVYMVGAFADALGAPSSVSSPSASSTPTIYNPVTKQLETQSPLASIMDTFNNLSTPMQIGVLATAGGLAYYALKPSKKSKKGARR